MDGVATQSPTDRGTLLRETAAKMPISPVIAEKDFWVCWTLKHTFKLPIDIKGLIFKGGTSLSKVYKAIERFSEDIDLAFDRRALGFDDTAFHKAASNNERKKRLEALSASCADYIRNDFQPALATAAGDILGKGDWELEIDSLNPQALIFHFPRSLEPAEYANVSSIEPMISLELGARSEQEPAYTKTVTPYAAEHYPDEFSDPSCDVKVLGIERTFWEKVTLLHGENHRAQPRDGLSRHYYDVATLYESDFGMDAVKRLDLLKATAKHSELFFYRQAARYDLARPGSLSLVPEGEMLKAVQRDYQSMQEMIFGEAPSFEGILSVLADMEKKINKG